MKIQELLHEGQTVSRSNHQSIPDMTSVGVPGSPIGPTNYYHKYRLGVLMAGSPDFEHEYAPNGQFVDDMVTVGYSNIDTDIINQANKKMGYKQKAVTSKGSKELEDTYKVSPVSNWMKTK
jgi:hypothetical protein